jgi:cytochrome c5
MVGLSGAACLAVCAQQSSFAAAQTAGNPASNQTHSIQLPEIPGEIPPGPHQDIYSKDCLLCHSARYVSMQPGFSKEVWRNEVKKMVDAYGAPIPEADQALIVEYLVSVRGPQSASAPAKPSK